MSIVAGVIEDFEGLTRFPLEDYLTSYINFVDDGRINILDYYAGKSKSPNAESFKNLDSLLNASKELNDTINNNRDNLATGAYWELLDSVEDIRTTLETIDNSSKWLRSAITKNDFNPVVEVDHTLEQQQTLEKVAANITSSSNRDQDWIQISLRNDMHEEAYDLLGGQELKVSGRNRSAISLKSVVDNIVGDRVYGIDIDKTLTFEDDDLKALNPSETITQAVQILADLRQGDTPEFPNDGIQSGLVVGSNIASIPFSILVRQFYNTFQKDDTLKSVQIGNIEQEEDAIKMSFEVQTRKGDAVIIETSI